MEKKVEAKIKMITIKFLIFFKSNKFTLFSLKTKIIIKKNIRERITFRGINKLCPSRQRSNHHCLVKNLSYIKKAAGQGFEPR